MMSVVGDTGAAYSLMMLVAALQESRPGDRIVMVSYGNGSDVLGFEVTEGITRSQIVFPIYGSGFRLVTPAQAGVQKLWIPASAGMTIKGSGT
jgi:hypothetical protein